MHVFPSINYQSRGPSAFMIRFLSYRFSFNGKENENEITGDGNAYDFGARIYDPRLGRFLSRDSRSNDFAFWSPYLYSANCPIRIIDINGDGPGDPNYKNTGNVLIILADDKSMKDKFQSDLQKIATPGWDFVIVTDLGDAVKWLKSTYGVDGSTINNLIIRTHGTPRTNDIATHKKDAHNERYRADVSSEDFDKFDHKKTDRKTSQLLALKGISNYLGDDANVLLTACTVGQDPAMGVEFADFIGKDKNLTVYLNKDYSHSIGRNNDIFAAGRVTQSNGMGEGWTETKKVGKEYSTSNLGTRTDMFVMRDGGIKPTGNGF